MGLSNSNAQDGETPASAAPATNEEEFNFDFNWQPNQQPPAPANIQEQKPPLTTVPLDPFLMEFAPPSTSNTINGNNPPRKESNPLSIADILIQPDDYT
jgi:hypothetical protein